MDLSGGANVLANAVQHWSTCSGAENTIEAVVASTQELAGVADVAITLAPTEQHPFRTHCTTDRTRLVEQAQHDLGQGPSYGAATAALTCSEQIGQDPRWPRWGHRATQVGLHSLVCAALVSNDRHLGALTLYGTTPAALSDHHTEQADLIARHAAPAIAAATAIEHLTTAIQTRGLIGEAMGITMERYKLDSPTAFKVLVRQSQAENIKLHVLCRSITGSNERYVHLDI